MQVTEQWARQDATLPEEGKHVVGSFDEENIVVYQAYRPSIAEWAIEHQRLGGPGFKLDRMSWIKPSYLWMMYRSGWGTKPNQQRVLALSISRVAFKSIVELGVPTSHPIGEVVHRGGWRAALRESDVLIQWDPDRNPAGAPLRRRAIQIGLRGQSLRSFAEDHVLEVRDVTPDPSVRSLIASGAVDSVPVPIQRLYPDELALWAWSTAYPSRLQ